METENPLEVTLKFVKSYTCSICDKAFKSKDALFRHEASHSGYKPFFCDICKQGLSSAVSLKEHKAKHEDVKLFNCSLCSKSFRQNSSFRRHLQIHSKFIYKPHLCTECPRSFSRLSDLNRHKILHSGNSPYKCVLCESTFADRSSHKRHMKSHSNNNLNCEFCPLSFKKSKQIKAHVSKMHIKGPNSEFSSQRLAWDWDSPCVGSSPPCVGDLGLPPRSLASSESPDPLTSPPDEGPISINVFGFPKFLPPAFSGREALLPKTSVSPIDAARASARAILNTFSRSGSNGHFQQSAFSNVVFPSTACPGTQTSAKIALLAVPIPGSSPVEDSFAAFRQTSPFPDSDFEAFLSFPVEDAFASPFGNLVSYPSAISPLGSPSARRRRRLDSYRDLTRGVPPQNFQLFSGDDPSSPRVVPSRSSPLCGRISRGRSFSTSSCPPVLVTAETSIDSAVPPVISPSSVPSVDVPDTCCLKFFKRHVAELADRLAEEACSLLSRSGRTEDPL